jgi:hypothetical protein
MDNYMNIPKSKHRAYAILDVRGTQIDTIYAKNQKDALKYAMLLDWNTTIYKDMPEFCGFVDKAVRIK